jgi:O-antigen ligase
VLSTVSFTPIAGTAAGCLLLLALAGWRSRWLVPIVVGGVVLAFVFGPLLSARYHEQFMTYAPVKERPYLPRNFNFRIDVWTTEYVPVLRRNLTTGYGPDLPPDLSFRYTESVYVTLLLRGGLPLLCVYVGLMLALAVPARDLWHDTTADVRALAQAVFLAVVLIVFMQMVTNYFVNSGFPFVFWVMAALLLGCPRRSPSPAGGA